MERKDKTRFDTAADLSEVVRYDITLFSPIIPKLPTPPHKRPTDTDKKIARGTARLLKLERSRTSFNKQRIGRDLASRHDLFDIKYSVPKVIVLLDFTRFAFKNRG
ncbi:hypothetical protein HYALB_00006724 [Hymenoscyphus albidus]|uniref:Uncharacterized protein n=1 Tax=Hymenoscyphus albidus TaxID=595503 RepID=A0A9N9LPW9_9HELO|nr:hypothetical protein HYALB_00006724 [Hymenoscyphus albidus]